MKKLLLILILSSLTFCGYAQKRGTLHVNQDSRIERLMKRQRDVYAANNTMPGYRVQIFSSNRQQTAKTEALELEEQIKEKVSQTVYVQYVAPFWKVRIGDFRTYDEAKEYKKIFVQQFPQMQGNTYIVRDKILVAE